MIFNDASAPTPAFLTWTEGSQPHSARWQSEAGVPPPTRVVVADDSLSAPAACHLAAQGTAMLWRGDFQNARQLLQAMARRLDKPRQRAAAAPISAVEAFNQHRMHQAQRARNLGQLLVPFDAGHVVPLRRAPDVQAACAQVYGDVDAPYVVSLRELLGVIGAYEWRKKGVAVAALGARIHPHYGVYSPVRGEYLALLAQAHLPKPPLLAFDIGTGTGVIAALLAQRGITQVVATDMDSRALACARENLTRLGFIDRVQLLQADLFPAGRAPLVVCNPPWLPAKPSAPIEHAIYDPGSQMLRGFLSGLAQHLEPGGQGWLILSDLAEHLGLRTRQALLDWIAQAGLQVLERSDIRPVHPKTQDATDPLHAARAAEVTSLWRLGAA
jgi:tRNA1(Val) A37 N6-methylase TrmN6